MDEIRNVQLYGGEFAVVDEKDFPLVSGFKWHCFEKRGLKYAVTGIYEPSKKRNRQVRMHRMIMGQDGPTIDHKNGNGLDNRRENLRHASGSQNQINSRKQSGRSSIFKGVSWNKQCKKWEAYINKNGTRYRLGKFTDEITAASIYNKMAEKLFGEFARLNVVQA